MGLRKGFLVLLLMEEIHVTILWVIRVGSDECSNHPKVSKKISRW